MKTPEEMYYEWRQAFDESFDERMCKGEPIELQLLHRELGKETFLAGYQAAKDTYKDAIDTYEDVAKQMLEEAVRIMSPKDQLADADKVMCNTTMEEIKAVDTGELMPITNLPTSAKWISVKERLPEHGIPVLTFETGNYKVNAVSKYTQWWRDSDEGFERNPTHWMPLPEAPKEK